MEMKPGHGPGARALKATSPLLHVTAVSSHNCVQLSKQSTPSLSAPCRLTMRLLPSPPSPLTSLLLLLPSLITGLSINCEDIRVEKTPFNFKPLDGPHSLYSVKEHPNTIKTTTFTFNICRPLERQKGVPSDEDCPNGSRGKSACYLLSCAPQSSTLG